MTMTTPPHTRNLVGDATGNRYLFLERVLPAGSATAFRCHPDDLRTYVVIGADPVDVEVADSGGSITVTRYRQFSGWHAPCGSVYRLVNPNDTDVLIVEAGTCTSETRERADAGTLTSEDRTAGCFPTAGYTVEKPWGHEVWYTQNLAGAPYAVKQIHMTAGHQSSLQSHRFKAETNYVVEGEATVLNGLEAPEDTSSRIDADRIPVSVHGPGTGWSSQPNVLHRVIARSTYTSIEVSTDELDDVIRWQDDTGRGHGRVETEHEGA